MGLTDTIKNAVAGGMKTLGDLKKDISYYAAVEGSSDGRGVTVTWPTALTVEATIVSYRNQEYQGQGGLIAPNDRKVIVEKRLLDLQSITVKQSDRLVLDDGRTYKIINHPTDPSRTVYFLQARQI